MADRAKVTSGWVEAAGPRAASGPAGSQESAPGSRPAAAATAGPSLGTGAGPPAGARRMGRRRARTVPATKTTMSSRNTQGPPRSLRTAMAGSAAAKAVSEASRPSWALAEASRLWSTAPAGLGPPWSTSGASVSPTAADGAGSHRRPGADPSRDRVGLGPGTDEQRDQRALGHQVDLGEHEHGEGLGEQQEALQTGGHDQADDGAAGGRDHHGGPAGPPAPVDDRTEKGGHDGEGRHGQKEIEDHLVLGRPGRDGEEQRSGQ